IWLSVNFDVFIKNLLRLWYEKILLLTSVNLWGDYLSSLAGALFPSNFGHLVKLNNFSTPQIIC
ncbi:hypothetical protein FLM10_06135, partial [Vibrio cholerae]